MTPLLQIKGLGKTFGDTRVLRDLTLDVHAGEFLVLLGAFRTYPILAFISTTAVIISAAYLLWAIQRILFNPLDKPVNEHIPDLNRRELLLLAPLVAAIIWLGLYPRPVLDRMQPAAERFVQTVEDGAARARSQWAA